MNDIKIGKSLPPASSLVTTLTAIFLIRAIAHWLEVTDGLQATCEFLVPTG
jgi:hypothetical protein